MCMGGGMTSRGGPPRSLPLCVGGTQATYFSNAGSGTPPIILMKNFGTPIKTKMQSV